MFIKIFQEYECLFFHSLIWMLSIYSLTWMFIIHKISNVYYSFTNINVTECSFANMKIAWQWWLDLIYVRVWCSLFLAGPFHSWLTILLGTGPVIITTSRAIFSAVLEGCINGLWDLHPTILLGLGFVITVFQSSLCCQTAWSLGSSLGHASHQVILDTVWQVGRTQITDTGSLAAEYRHWHKKRCNYESHVDISAWVA